MPKWRIVMFYQRLVGARPRVIDTIQISAGLARRNPFFLAAFCEGGDFEIAVATRMGADGRRDR